VVLADDDVLLREGLASLLDRSGLEVVGQAGDAEELIEVRQQQPELAVVDIRMPNHATEGLDAARVIQREFPATAVVVLSAHVECNLVAPVRRGDYQRASGDSGYHRYAWVLKWLTVSLLAYPITAFLVRALGHHPAGRVRATHPPQA
jgi:CheY-like chemotaxis protein